MESVNSLEKFLADTWLNIVNLVCKSVVYIDDAATECLHWHTGGKVYSFFKDAGAIAVYQLTMYNSHYTEVKNCKKVVIISTSNNPAFYQRAIKMIMEKNAFRYCTIVTAAHPNVLSYEDTVLPEDRANYNKFSNDIKSSMHFNQDCSVTILFRPIFISLIDNNLFVTPPLSHLLPPLNSALIKDSKCAIEHLVSLFNSLFTYLNLREDIYSIGKFSEYVAEKLETSSAAIKRRNDLIGAKDNGVSLIFIDRTLDFCTPTSSHTESLLSKILCTLPHLSHHCNDVAVDMSPLFNNIQIPGCLASNNKSFMNMLIMQKQREVLTTINKIVIDILSAKKNPETNEKPKPRLATRLSAQGLQRLIDNFTGIDDLNVITESSKDLQIVLAIVEALTSEKNRRLETLNRFEELALQNITASYGSMNFFDQFSKMIKTRKTRNLDTDDILVLLVHIYALAGTEIQFAAHQEEQLEKDIADAIYEDIVKLNEDIMIKKMSVYQQTLLLFDVADVKGVTETSMKIAKHIMNVLREIAQQRAFLHDYTSLISKSGSNIVQRIGILQQLLTDILHPDRRELPALHQKSSFISAGFNLLSKGRMKRHPCDNNWIILYVIGGVTAEEVRELRELISSYKSKCQITIGGSRLLSPLDIVDKVILSSIKY